MKIQEFCQTFGVEIEMKYITRQEIATLLQEYFNTRYIYLGGTYDKYLIPDDKDRKWQVVSDSSLHDSNKGCEVVTPILEYDDLDTLKNIINLIGISNKVVIDEECGVHVHIGNTFFTARTLRNLQNLMYNYEPLLFEMLNVDLHSYRALNYCKLSDTHFVQKLNEVKPRGLLRFADIWYSSQFNTKPRNNHYNETRYHNLNLHAFFNKGTVEFRLFNGTLDSEMIISYVLLSLALCCYSCGKTISVKMDDIKYKEKDSLFRLNKFLDMIGLDDKEYPINNNKLLESMLKKQSNGFSDKILDKNNDINYNSDIRLNFY